MSRKRSVDRRRFLALSGTVGVAALLAACRVPSSPAPASTAGPASARSTVEPASASVKATAAPAQPASLPKSYVLDTVPSQLTEASSLSELVKQGKLPPLKDRLPAVPLVLDRKGKYGGTMRTATNQKELFPWVPTKYGGGMQGVPLRLSPDLSGYAPNVLKGVDVSKDFKVMTFFMREGMKWSDGHPHTADDWQFYYDDFLNNVEVNPLPLAYFRVGGEMMKFTRVDDYTFRFQFAAPNPSFPLVNMAHVFGFSHDNALPAHYLKQFHSKYNAQANEQAKAEQFEGWAQWFISKKEPDQNPDVPRLGAYIVDQVTPQAVFYKRNPYFWMVDSDGKQLPYLDAIQMDRIDDLAVIEAKSVSGNFDFAGTGLFVKNFKSYKDGETKGGYKVYTWKSGKNEQLYNFNFNYPDEAWRTVFRDVRFRRALSVAINRDEINEVLFFGLGTPSQMTAHRTSKAYKEQYAKAWAQYDPTLANKLLDEMGLQWDGAHKLRLLADGRPMQLSFEVNGPNPIHEMVAEYWRKVGVQMDHKPVLRSVLKPKILANQLIMSAWSGDEIMDTLLARRPKWFAPIYGDESTWAPLWALWYFSHGSDGEVPPPEIKQLYDWMDQYAATNDIQYVDKLLASQAENIWSIGTITDGPIPLIFSASMKNVPESDYWVWDALDGFEQYPEAWYFDK